MRQGQQQNRQRSRNRNNNNRNNNNNNNRNQLNRSMESNGPDVRIRGTAAHISEKYTQLARDAQTAGDTVAAESYWQFAEHYNRLIATAQAALAEEQAKREEERARREGPRNDDGAEGDGEDSRGRRPRRGRNENRNENRNDERDETKVVADSGNVSDVSAGDGPQPTLDEPPVEMTLKQQPSEDAATNGAADSDDAEAKPRRARRPRKAAEDGDKAPKAEKAAKKPKAPVAASDDASALPAFLTGE